MQNQIENVMDNFNFSNVHTAMVALDWKWDLEGEQRVPTEIELRQTARRLLTVVIEEDTSIATGGFWAGKDDGNLQLEFCLEHYINE